jgi:hypothetical protein
VGRRRTGGSSRSPELEPCSPPSHAAEIARGSLLCTYRNICVEADSYETCVDIGIADPAERYRGLRRYGGIAALGHHAPFAWSPALYGQVRDRLSHANETLEGSKISRIQR